MNLPLLAALLLASACPFAASAAEPKIGTDAHPAAWQVHLRDGAGGILQADTASRVLAQGVRHVSLAVIAQQTY